jgi:putative glutathione S-transferase
MSQKIEIQKFANKDGEFKRLPSSFRNTISVNGPHLPEINRYHLYVSYACPWAHRTLITRLLKGLTGIIGVTVVHWHMDNNGWRFATNDEKIEAPDSTPDPLYGFQRLKELYFKANPNYEGRFTVPVLWDKKLETIVNNESSEIIRIFNTQFNSLISPNFAKIDLYPDNLKDEIDELNDWIYPTINNGVYKAGFATMQEPYIKEVTNVFQSLDKLENILKERHDLIQEYLLGDILTEADIRLFTTLIRFDPVYHQHFKCNIKMIRHDYPHIHRYLRNLYWKHIAFKNTTNFVHIKSHYTKSHPAINPHGITPVGPLPNIMPLYP